MTLREELDSLKVKVVRKDHSKLMRFIGRLFALIGYDFMDRAWTTVSGKTIYAPLHAPEDLGTRQDLTKWEQFLRHELVHIKQARKYPVLWQFSYAFLFFPVLFAWFRWKWERDAYLAVDINTFGRDSDEVSETLWKVYLFPWPKSWMKKWFRAHRRA